MTEEATYMNTLQAARYLGLSDKTLRRYRVHDGAACGA